MAKARKVVLRFPHRLVDKPIIYRLVKDYDLQFNILKASITPEEEGLLVLELSGKKKNYEEAISFLTGAGVETQLLAQDVLRNEGRCTHCGACVTQCPVNAFRVDLATRQVEFIETRCIACELCIKACPVRAMEVHL
ncbi:MAG: 4Fe-4S binding protein [Dehalococcoidia bacterium]|nr:MAG: 4Fe-4S binding protein [Dehalococcoidia bacterium]UCG83635.1 MAG: 4Fe-4S binding protein [Dehalococcoidia bacterium]